MTEKDKAAQDILKILNKFDPGEWQDLIGENSIVQACLSHKMKQIKFRGKSKITGEIIYGDLSHYEGRSYIDDEAVYEDSIAQFVGYDTNGKEIYADDFILETPFPDAVPQKYLAGDRIAANRFGEKFDNVELKESQDEKN